MQRRLCTLILFLVLLPAAAPAREVLLLTFDGPISPVAAEFFLAGIDAAQQRQAELLIIQLDTPGGLDTSMRSIIKRMSSSTVPIAVYVAPAGARAASAGTFLTIAAHLAVMAPGTNIGAATPVTLTGGMDETMAAKVTNDAAAYIRSLAEQRKRNAHWAELAVRKGVSISAEEAKRLAVIDLVADDVPTLLTALDGRRVHLEGGPSGSREVSLSTRDATLQTFEMSWRLRVLNILANPNLAYLLLLLGFYGLIFELSSPGSIGPGILGGISLILGFYALQVLPVNYAGLLLILLALALFLLELVVPSFGMLTMGGIVSMFLGSLLLFDRSVPFLRISLAVIIPAIAATAAFCVLLLGAVIRTHRKPPSTGLQALVNQVGTSRSPFPGTGTVLVHGELWRAMSQDTIAPGDLVRIVSVQGLTLTVEREKEM